MGGEEGESNTDLEPALATEGQRDRGCQEKRACARGKPEDAGASKTPPVCVHGRGTLLNGTDESRRRTVARPASADRLLPPASASEPPATRAKLRNRWLSLIRVDVPDCRFTE